MHSLQITSVPRRPRGWWRRPSARWLASFIGFPLGGFAAILLVGPVDDTWAAVAGGLITGVFIGAAQALGLGERIRSRFFRRWVAATTVGLTVGLGVGAAVVDYSTSLTAVVTQGALCGLAVGAAQTFAVRARLGRLAMWWPIVVALSWAVGWAVTTVSGIQVDQQFTVFGAFGAIAATALTVVLPLTLQRIGTRT